MSHIEEITPTEFTRRWPGIDRNEVTLLDVREPAELERAKIANTVDIPMNQIPARLADLDKRRPVVVICHSGQRSRRVAQFLLAEGFERVFNLTGGIDAWSQQVDSSIPRY